MRHNTAVAGLLAIASLLGSCIGENLGAGLSVINDSDATLFLYGTKVPAHGGAWSYDTTECSDTDLVARTKKGEVYAELTEEFCPGQTWTITGPGQGTLEDSQ